MVEFLSEVVEEMFIIGDGKFYLWSGVIGFRRKCRDILSKFFLMIWVIIFVESGKFRIVLLVV